MFASKASDLLGIATSRHVYACWHRNWCYCCCRCCCYSCVCCLFGVMSNPFMLQVRDNETDTEIETEVETDTDIETVIETGTEAGVEAEIFLQSATGRQRTYAERDKGRHIETDTAPLVTTPNEFGSLALFPAANLPRPQRPW